MIFESQYRRRALQLWKQQRLETKNELTEWIKKKRNTPSNGFVYLLTCFAAWISNDDFFKI